MVKCDRESIREDMLTGYLTNLETEIEMRSVKSSILKAAALLLALATVAVFAVSCKDDNSSNQGSTENEYKPDFKIGSTFKLGVYEQDNNEENGKEPIEWMVIGKDGEKALVISVKGLDSVPFNESGEETTWEKSTIRKWLNSVFYENAFTEEEKAFIKKVTVPADFNPEYMTDPGADTSDSVFLLSTAEAEKYFEKEEDRKCVPTAYAVAKGVWPAGAKGQCWWFLRTPGSDGKKAADVNVYGSMRLAGENVQATVDAVRPAFWIDLTQFPTPKPKATKAPTAAPESTPEASGTSSEEG